MAMVIYNIQNEITGFAEFNYPTENTRSYHRAFLGHDEFFIFLEVRPTDIFVDVATRDFKSINPDRRASLTHSGQFVLAQNQLVLTYRRVNEADSGFLDYFMILPEISISSLSDVTRKHNSVMLACFTISQFRCILIDLATAANFGADLSSV